jgi:hypothetical protein
LRQRDVRVVRRIKRAAKHANALSPWRLCGAQTQSRLTRNSWYSRSSVDPASTWR